jgi:hypothetical protein
MGDKGKYLPWSLCFILATSPPLLPVIGASVAAVEKAKQAREIRRMAWRRRPGWAWKTHPRHLQGESRHAGDRQRESEKGRDREGGRNSFASGFSARPMKMF